MLNDKGRKRESYRKTKHKQGIFHEESADFIKLINYYNRVYKIKFLQNQTGASKCGRGTPGGRDAIGFGGA